MKGETFEEETPAAQYRSWQQTVASLSLATWAKLVSARTLLLLLLLSCEWRPLASLFDGRDKRP